MSYVLATNEARVRWYKFPMPVERDHYELIEVLDTREVPMWGDKESAKLAAIALGLKTWRYVKLK